ncbi:MAG: SDR family NAD(P)-dependent oxidoreductase [Caulobacteraceae bacterium]
MTDKVWFITGTSKGFGRVWAEAALARGDRVAATARDVKTLQPLVDQYGDLVAGRTGRHRQVAVAAAVAETIRRFGRIDVAVNNAGYGLFGTIEEVSEAEARAQLETNLFGALWVTQAVLPQMREQGRAISSRCRRSRGSTPSRPSGSITRLSGGWRASASRWRRSGRLRIKVTIVEPGGFATEWGGVRKRATPMQPTTGPAPRSPNSAAATPLATLTPLARPSSRSSTPPNRRCASSSAPQG